MKAYRDVEQNRLFFKTKVEITIVYHQDLKKVNILFCNDLENSMFFKKSFKEMGEYCFLFSEETKQLFKDIILGIDKEINFYEMVNILNQKSSHELYDIKKIKKAKKEFEKYMQKILTM